ncbi:MAG: peptidoglycan-binding protein [Geitlerinemataceae cyanobacterium]
MPPIANSTVTTPAISTAVPPVTVSEKAFPSTVAINLPTLQIGQAGEAVRFLQQRLKTFKYPIDFNGQFGRQIDAAIKHFQAHHGGLLVDGIVGSQTWKALCESVHVYGYFFETEFISTTYSYDIGMPSLRQGITGEAVECLQIRLQNSGYEIAVDGIFGNQTEKTVIAYQKRANLVADGIVGRQTWRQLGE